MSIAYFLSCVKCRYVLSSGNIFSLTPSFIQATPKFVLSWSGVFICFGYFLDFSQEIISQNFKYILVKTLASIMCCGYGPTVCYPCCSPCFSGRCFAPRCGFYSGPCGPCCGGGCCSSCGPSC